MPLPPMTITPSTQTTTPGVATGNYTVSLPVGVTGQNQAVALSDNGGGGTFSPTSLNLLNGATTGTFTYTNAAAGVYTLTATCTSGPSGGKSAGATAVVATGSVTPTGFIITPASASAGAGIACGPYTIELTGAGGAPATAPGGGQAFALTVYQPGGSFAPGTTVTVGAGQSSVAFTFQDNTPGTYVLTATAAGSPYGTNIQTALAVIGGTMAIPQSGKPTAVGFGAEQVWGILPVTGSGGSTTVGIASSVTQAYADLAGATTGTALNTATSATRPFVAGDVGSTMVITGGTNWITGRYVITAVNTGTHTATFDRAVTSATSATSGAGSLYNQGAPERYCNLLPCNGMAGKPDVYAPKEIDGDIQTPTRTALLAMAYDGDFSLVPDPESLQYVLSHMFGSDQQTLIAAGVYDHVMTPFKWTNSLWCEELFGDHTHGRLTSGVVFTKTELTLGAQLEAKITAYGKHQIPGSYPLNGPGGALTEYDYSNAAAAYPTQMGGDAGQANLIAIPGSPGFIDVAQGNTGSAFLPFAALQYGGQTSPINFATSASFIAYSDITGAWQNLASAIITEGSTITIDRSLGMGLSAGSALDPGYCVPSDIAVSGKLSMLYMDNTVLKALRRHASVAINLQWVGPQIGSTGYYYTLEIFIPRARIIGAPQNIPDGPMTQEVTFVAERDPSLLYHSWFRLRNAFNMAIGGAYQLGTFTGPGGIWLK